MDIALKSNVLDGYKSDQLIEIWKAAHATGSDVIIEWWSHESFQQSLQGTEAVFVKVELPTPTASCMVDTHRRYDTAQLDRCERVQNFAEENMEACDTPPELLQKIISKALYQLSKDPSIPEGLQSPAYDVLSLLKMTGIQLSDIFSYKNEKRTTREAISMWVVDNFAQISEKDISKDYPRTVQEADGGAVMALAISIAAVAATGAVVTTGLVFAMRKKKVMAFAQIEFLFLLLSGLLLISIASLLVALTPTDGTSGSSVWLLLIGYTLEFVPLIIKVTAVNQLMNAASRMRSVVLKKKKNLFRAVAGVLLAVIVYLIIWTALNPPLRTADFQLTSTIVDGETLVEVRYYCLSESRGWMLGAICWNAFLLLISTVLAFQTRKVRQEFNESLTLGLMVYSHFLFVIIRLVLVTLPNEIDKSTWTACLSMVYSIDVIGTLILYFVPKLLIGSEKLPSSSRMKKAAAWMESNQATNQANGGASEVTEPLPILQSQYSDKPEDEGSTDPESPVLSTQNFPCEDEDGEREEGEPAKAEDAFYEHTIVFSSPLRKESRVSFANNNSEIPDPNSAKDSAT